MPMKIEKKIVGDALQVTLDGVLDETSPLDKMIGPVPSELNLNLAGIRRINSAGVKGMINYFSSLRKAGKKLRFQACSSAFAQQLSIFSNIALPTEIESVYVPFLCRKCNQETHRLFTAKQLLPRPLHFPPIPCEACGGSAEFDDLPEVYEGIFHRHD